MLNGQVNGKPASILVHTGAATCTTVLSKVMWDCAKGVRAQLQSTSDRKLVGVQGTPLHMHGSACV